ncbi:S8 family serine peptidase [Dermatobacter hominis]|uniref:S8 family serine peptidase n=1 Tax=Dermatobacter hominis TaxID=2884263 RepID=UPI001D119D65|nr:S8 family serine peptidase [Dermatobacter hominis]UDY37275.1 FG-GAP-like repeat-containing protein [Dermatobacter hominis]
MVHRRRSTPSRRVRRTSAVIAITVAVAASCTAAPPTSATGPTPAVPDRRPAVLHGTDPEPLDCGAWRYDGVAAGPLPGEWDPDDHRFGSFRDDGSAASPHRHCGQLGAAVDLAWGVDRGRPDVVIAVIDSGIRWRDAGAMADLADQAYLNRGELPAPQGDPGGAPQAVGADPYDRDGDGRFTVADFAADPRVEDRNANRLLDPEDLILTPGFSDGTDDDGNGYVDDISGWDFLHDDNDPLDDVDYGHGTGEARDSTAAHDGHGAAGTCPRCLHLPVRVSDSFIADGSRFAASVLFALDSGADVVQEALGAINSPPQAQAAIDAAWRRGVPVVASMADEQSQHANLPAALSHTIPVNSVTEGSGFLGDLGATLTGRRDGLAINGCTNTGGIAWVTVPSDGCSSEATGNSAGMVGLLESTARSAGVQRHPALVAAGVTGADANVLSAAEVAQVLRATADDVDLSTPNVHDPANEDVDDLGQRRFPTSRGWDATTGYGRINAYEAVRAVQLGAIPPEADLTGPARFGLLPTSGTVAVTGRVAAVRSPSFSYRVEWATGLQPPPWPGRDEWHVVGSGTGLTAPLDGDLGELDLAAVAAALPDGGRGTPTTAVGTPDPDRFTVRLRVVVTDADGRVGIDHRHVVVHDDPDRIPTPEVPGAGAASPAFADLDGDGAHELLVATDDGLVHALRSPDAAERELPGWPVSTGAAPYWHPGSPTAGADAIAEPARASGIGAPAVADLDGDRAPEVVVADLEGGVHVYGADGRTKATMRSDPRFSRGERTDERNRMKPGFVGGAALGDLDGDGGLDVVAAAMDRHVYAWHADGTPLEGFPVLVVDPAQVAAIDADSHAVSFRDPEATGQGGEIVVTPALGDLDGDGRPEVVVGTQEQYDERPAAFPGLGLPGRSGNTRLFAISPDGTSATSGTPFLPGWPVALPMFLTSVLPTIGDGVAAQAAIGDVDGDGGPEVVASSVSGQTMVLDADGRTPYGRPFGVQVALGWLGAVGPGTNSADTAALTSAFGGPAIGRLGSPVGLDVAAPTTGAGRAIDTLLSNDQAGDPQLTAWSGVDGSVRNGFPRVTADVAFFVTPAIADVDGDGGNEVVAANGVQMLDAVDGDGVPARGWPKVTGGWAVGTPGFGDWDGDGRAEVAITRRDGHLLVWQLPTEAAAIGDWTRFGANDRNDGSVGPPGP